MNKNFTTNNINNLYTTLNIISKYIPSHEGSIMTIDNSYNYDATRIIIELPTDAHDVDYESYVRYYVDLPCRVSHFTYDNIQHSGYSLKNLKDLLEDKYDAKLLIHYDESIKDFEIKSEGKHTNGDVETARYQNSSDYLKDAESITKELCSFFNNSFNIRRVGCSIFIDSNALSCISDIKMLKSDDSIRIDKDLKIDSNYYLHNVLSINDYNNSSFYVGCHVFNK